MSILSDPWRIRCPECGSVSIDLNTQTQRKRDESVSYLDTGGPHPKAYELPPRCRCNECGEGFDKPLDAKTQERVEV